MSTRGPGACVRDGFTVVEIMIAITILSICMFSTIGLMRWVVRGTDYSGRLTVATAYAQGKLEQVCSGTYNSIAGGSDNVNGYARAWTVTDNGSYKMVSVNTTFTPVDGSQRSITLAQIISP